MELYEREQKTALFTYVFIMIIGGKRKKPCAFIDSCIPEILLHTIFNTVLDILGNIKIEKINSLLLRSLYIGRKAGARAFTIEGNVR